MVERLNTLIVNVFSRLQREEGQGAVEYALILAAVVGAVAAGVLILGPAITTKLSDVAGSF